MDREEAINTIKANYPIGGYHDLCEALDMAIKALELQPCDKYIKEIDHLRKYICKLETQIVEQEHCEDAISRQAVLNILDDMVREYIKENDFDKAQGVAWVKVQKLSSVSTENKVNVLDKIRAEIMLKDGLEEALEIIDKYKAERNVE